MSRKNGKSLAADSAPPKSWTIGSLIGWAADDFRARGIENPRLDAEVIVAHALSCTRMQLIIDSQRPLSGDELTHLRELVKRRRAREPVAYLQGHREFYGRAFKVDARVLIPRPDTETLVDVALARTSSKSLSMRALDMCTGSGCVGITLARQRPTSTVVLSDVSAAALDVARENAHRLGAHNVTLLSGDLFDALNGYVPLAPPALRTFDLITANPPYIPSAEVETLVPDIRSFEPRIALDGGTNGLDLVKRIVEQARKYLAPGGVLALEIGDGEADATSELFTQCGFVDVQKTRDLGRIERVVSGIAP